MKNDTIIVESPGVTGDLIGPQAIVTLKFSFMLGEDLSMTDQVTDETLASMAFALSMVRRDKAVVSRDTKSEPAVVTKAAHSFTEGEEVTVDGRQAIVTGGHRRRRVAVPQANPTASVETASKTSPATAEAPATSVSRRNRRPTSAVAGSVEAPVNSSPATAQAPVPSTGNRRQRSTPTSNTKTTKSPSDAKLTHSDASKAASEAASIIMPKGVMDILAQFGVDGAHNLKLDQIQEFIDLVQDAVDRENK